MRIFVAALFALIGVGLSATESSANCYQDAYGQVRCGPPAYHYGGGGYGQPYYGGQSYDGGHPYYGQPHYYERRRPDVGAAIALGIVGAAAAAIASQQRYGHRKRVYRRR